MFVDQITANVEAGNGGDGVVRWRREAGVAKGGPPAATAATAAMSMCRLCAILASSVSMPIKTFLKLRMVKPVLAKT